MREPDEIVNLAQQCHGWATTELVQVFPGLLHSIIGHNDWTTRVSKVTEKPFESFYEFAIHPLQEGLALVGGEEMSYEDAIKYSAVRHPEIASELRTLIPPLDTFQEAGAKGGRGNKARNMITGFRGTASTYLTRRIARDHPDIHERMQSGEFRSVRQAAIEAGIVKVPTPLEVALKAFAKLDRRERETFLTEIKGRVKT